MSLNNDLKDLKELIKIKDINDLEDVNESNYKEIKSLKKDIESLLISIKSRDEEIKNFKKYSHTPCYLKLDRSQPEKEFEIFLEVNKI